MGRQLVLLAMEEVLSFGFNLVVSSPSDSRGSMAHIYIVAIQDKKIGVLPYCLDLSLYIMSSFLRRYSILVSLIH